MNTQGEPAVLCRADHDARCKDRRAGGAEVHAEDAERTMRLAAERRSAVMNPIASPSSSRSLRSRLVIRRGLPPRNTGERDGRATVCAIGMERGETPPLSASRSRVVSLSLQNRPEQTTLDFVFGARPQKCPQSANRARWHLSTERKPSPFVPILFFAQRAGGISDDFAAAAQASAAAFENPLGPSAATNRRRS